MSRVKYKSEHKENTKAMFELSQKIIVIHFIGFKKPGQKETVEFINIIYFLFLLHHFICSWGKSCQLIVKVSHCHRGNLALCTMSAHFGA